MTVDQSSSAADADSAPPEARNAEFGTEVDLLSPLLVLGRYRRWLWSWPLVGIAVAAAFTMLWPATYTATTRILPPAQNQSSAGALLAQIGGAAGALGGALGVKTPTELYIGMMRSDGVSDAIIERFDLMHVYGKKYRDDARRKLTSRSGISAGKDGIITIDVDDRDRQRSADIANAFVDELHRLTSTLAISDAAQRRVFFEKQLETAKNRLADAEVALQRAVATTGIASAVGQAGATLETMARLRAQITAKQIQIEAMGAYATAGNPDRLRIEGELAAMRAQLARMEGAAPAAKPDARDPRAGTKADAGIDNIRLLRDVKYNEVLFELLARQYELARLDESKEAPLVQVLDRAAPPEKRSFPRFSVMLPIGAVLGLLLAVISAFGSNAYANALAERSSRARVEALRAAWFPRSQSSPTE